MPDLTPRRTPPDVRRRRERLLEAVRFLERRCDAPADEPDRWRLELRQAVEVLDDVVAAHVVSTEDPGGLFEEVVDATTGRLTAAVDDLRRDHRHITQLLGQLLDAIRADGDIAELRTTAGELARQLEAHRHRGADLLWQAYEAEIGVGD